MKLSPIGMHSLEARSKGISERTPEDSPSEFIVKEVFKDHFSVEKRLPFKG
jgi:hypothetical protein